MFKQNWQKSSTWQISNMGCLLVSRIFASSKTCITISILYFFTFCNQTMAYPWLLHALKVESFVTMIKPLNYCCQSFQTPIKCQKKPWILFKSLKNPGQKSRMGSNWISKSAQRLHLTVTLVKYIRQKQTA